MIVVEMNTPYSAGGLVLAVVVGVLRVNVPVSMTHKLPLPYATAHLIAKAHAIPLVLNTYIFLRDSITYSLNDMMIGRLRNIHTDVLRSAVRPTSKHDLASLYS